MAVIRSLEIVLRPNRTQERRMLDTVGHCCFLYNHLLEYCREQYEKGEKHPSEFDLDKHITEFKKEHPELKNVYSQVLTNVSTRLSKAFDGFFRRVKEKKEEAGYPRFRSFHRYDSFTYTQNGFSLKNGHLELSKIGPVKAYGIRKMTGKLKTCTIKREGFSPHYRWKALLTYEFDDISTGFIEDTRIPCGIDLGLTDTVTVSDGKFYTNSKQIVKAESSIARIQRKISKYDKGTEQRNRYKQHLFHAFSNLKRKMKAERFRIVNELIDNHNIIAFESLNIKALEDKSLGKGMRKSYRDACWGYLLQTLRYKAEEAGTGLIEVNPAYTSQMCSLCGNIVEKELSERRHRCPHCGLDIGRDLNAARNILRLGLQALQSGTDEWRVVPVGKDDHRVGIL